MGHVWYVLAWYVLASGWAYMGMVCGCIYVYSVMRMGVGTVVWR